MINRRKVKILREAKELETSELARRLNISVAAMSRIEAGTMQPSFAVAAALADELGVTVDDLREKDPK